MKLRLISRLSVVTLVIVVAVIILLHQHVFASSAPHPARATQTSSPNSLHGINQGTDAAPASALVDQTGARVALSAFAGHPVVVTFLSTHCPDVCPLTAEKLRTTAFDLGTQATQIDWVAISVDPVGDTPTTATAFVATHHLTSTLHYLLGTQAQLTPVWTAYHIAVTPGADPQIQVGSVTHTIGVFVIDKQGRARELFGDIFDPTQLSADLRLLLAE